MTTIDRILVLGGLAIAIGSAGFAGYMLENRSHEPYIVGMKYLSIFARPRGTQEARADHSKGDLDFTPTGSLADSEPDPAPNAHSAEEQRLIAVADGHAWLRTGRTFREVKAGDELPGFGAVQSIRRINGVWTMVMADGSLVRAGEDEAGGRFDRPMIFGP
jgi:hypothetical protein